MDTTKPQCNYLNDVLDATEWDRIDAACKSRGHIADNVNVKDVIQSDEKKLSNHGITFQQLDDFFKKLVEHVDHEITHGRELKHITDTECDMVEKAFKEINMSGWCCWGRNSVKIFHGAITVVKLTWGGAEVCPFQSLNDKKYHGYEYGSIDYVFMKGDEYIHVGNLLFHQIVQHHFFQDASSKFHVDVGKLIEFFNIRPDINYETSIGETNVLNLTKVIDIDERNSFESIATTHKINDTKTIEKDQYFDLSIMTHEIIDVNEYYYDDECVIMILKNKETKPKFINGCACHDISENPLFVALSKLMGKPPKKEVVIEVYRVDKQKCLTDEELGKNWL